MTEPRGLGKQDIQPILDELKRGLEEIYGSRLRQVILFGSFARGDAEPGSDIDVAVVLHDIEKPFTEDERASDLATRVSLENNTVVQFLYLRSSDMDDPWQPVHFNILREGVPA